ncbi:hypothetical protein LMG23992_01471 [Cupriavidus laharis]|uniref:Phage tail protein (Tail_P2_I) n=1 Tax=Cupriavidus laharis TaxID=151654 RepID=A0ABM8WRS9_9BURK|nr:hypothetical protein [Cupriavidus laharis]CAG9170123.1 hypothetical protein LMG23992_01471 [Cupriavidus laharis]
MSISAERLYSLLPAVYRLRDAEQGEPLRALLAAFAQEFAALEENVAQLYDDQFIETCADWVAPYIGDLIGYRPLHGVSPRIASPRAEVAHTIAFRRRKGTALMLEELAQDVTDWPAHAVEFFTQLATTQYMKHVRLQAPATAPLRDLPAMLRLGGAFNAVARTAEMRRPESGAGRYNIPNVGIFLWRLLALRLSAIPLTPDPDDASGRRFRLNPLGADCRLFRRAQTEDDISHLAEPVNVPEPLGVRLMALAVRAAQGSTTPAPDARLDDDYGPAESLALLRPGNPPVPVPVGSVRVCDLRDIVDGGGNVVGWNHEDAVPAGTIGFDPERGRVLLGAAEDGPLLATFHYGQARAIGGGEYERAPEGGKLPVQRTVGQGGALQPELDAIAGGGRLLIQDSLAYAQTPVLKVDPVLAPNAPGRGVVVAAASSARPLVAASGDVTLDIGARGRLVIEGIVFSGGALRLPAGADDEPRELVLRDCTLVPGLALHPDGNAVSPGAVSLVIGHPFASVTLERCITGPILAVPDAEVTLRDCIVDAGAPENTACAAGNTGGPGARLTLAESTVIGKVHASVIVLASDSLFFARLGAAPGETWTAPVIAERRQEGCVRFCFVPAGAITPQRYRCVPDAQHPGVMPHFTSLRYGDPGYGQLRHATDKAIREGASDGGEMGVLHALFQPQRETNLRIRLDEYLRFGLHAGIFYAT